LKYEKVDLAFESNYQPVEKHLNCLFEILSYCIEKEKQEEERARAGGERELNDWTWLNEAEEFGNLDNVTIVYTHFQEKLFISTVGPEALMHRGPTNLCGHVIESFMSDHAAPQPIRHGNWDEIHARELEITDVRSKPW
jgi:hypothetical protein